MRKREWIERDLEIWRQIAATAPGGAEQRARGKRRVAELEAELKQLEEQNDRST